MKIFSAVCLVLSFNFALANNNTDLVAKDQARRAAFAELKGVVKSIDVLVGEDKSCQNATDCLALPIGKRACGGPDGYKVVSKFNSHLNSIIKLAKTSEEFANFINQEHNVISICTLEMEPSVVCKSNACAAAQ